MKVHFRSAFGACILLLTASLQAAGPAPVRIELPATVGVARPEVSLGDVAAMTTPDVQLLKRLMALPLGPAPAAGDKVQLGRAQLMRWVQARTGLRPEQIEWEGAQVTEVRRASSEIAGAQVTAVAGDTLRTWLAARSARADVAVTSVPRDMAVPLGQSTLRARPIPADAALARRMVVWVDVWVEDRFVRTVPVGFDVAAYGPAFVARADLPQGARVDVAALNVREVELTGRVVPVLSAASPLPGAVSGAVSDGPVLQLRRPLPAGKPLTRGDVQDAPAVARGDWVALSVHSGLIEMESRVEALQDGRVGQTVNVKPAKAGGPILARVTGPGRVEVTQ